MKFGEASKLGRHLTPREQVERSLRRRRRGWISKKKVHELYRKRANGCWIWFGSVHKATGNPIYKGWFYPRRVVYERFKGALLEGYRIRGTTCGKKLCVCPDHQIIIKRKRLL